MGYTGIHGGGTPQSPSQELATLMQNYHTQARRRRRRMGRRRKRRRKGRGKGLLLRVEVVIGVDGGMEE